jgi:dihydroxyacetone kinase-like predicted kinase
MAEAIETIETAEVTTAVRSARINGISVKKGEVIGLVNGTLRVKGNSPAEVVKAALEQMNSSGYEIITVYYGESITADEAQQLAAEIAQQYTEQEIELVDGGQPHYHYILSTE